MNILLKIVKNYPEERSETFSGSISVSGTVLGRRTVKSPVHKSRFFMLNIDFG